MSKRMLYRHPGKYKIHGNLFDYIVIEEDEVPRYLELGWFLTTMEALKKKHAVVEKPPAQDIPKRSYADLSDEERRMLGSIDAGLEAIARKFNVTAYAVRKCRNELD